MGLGQTIRGLSGGVLPAALGHRTFRLGSYDDDFDGKDGAAAYDIELFEISGGPVLLTFCYGKVTAVIAGGATLQLQHFPTDLAQEVMCTVLAAIGGDPADTIYIIPGIVAGAMAKSAVAGVSDAAMHDNMLYLLPGIMNLEVTVASITAGAIDWTLHWVPLDFDSRVRPIY